jgi:hypothetical protein
VKLTMSLVARVTILGALILPGTSSGKPQPSTAAPTYHDPQRMHFETFLPDRRKNVSAEWAETGPIAPKRPLTEADKDPWSSEVLVASLINCSDEKVRCMYSVNRVFAVPKAGFRPDSSFDAGGARFKVERCLRGTDELCQVALVSSDCQLRLPSGECKLVPGGREASTAPGMVGYFIYNEDFGVTAYGGSRSALPTFEAQRAAAVSMVLQGEYGLLRESLGRARSSHAPSDQAYIARISAR